MALRSDGRSSRGSRSDHAQHTERVAAGRLHRRARIKPDVRRRDHERIPGKPLIPGRVRHLEKVPLFQDVAAKGKLVGNLRRVHAHAGLKPFATPVHQPKQRVRRAAGIGSEAGEVVKLLLRPRI